MESQLKPEDTVNTIEELKEYIDMTPQEEEKLKEVIRIHPMRITKYYLSLIDKNDKKDPIRKMVVPSIEELNPDGFYDTSGEKQNTKMIGLQHKYFQTALILATNRCASYCRFCFRKRLVGLPTSEILDRLDAAVEYIKKHEEIDNVLISGGDPLILSTKIIEKFLKALSPIPHLKYIRFGSRIPVVYPQRITNDKELLEVFKKYSRRDNKVYVITQFNHPQEITEESVEAVNALLDSNVLLNNQTVLLKGVNDDSEVLAELFNKLVKIDILPYYVFQCRPVKRVKHFQVPLYTGYEIFEGAKKRIKAHLLCKRLKYIMSHPTGKVEIIGIMGDEIFFKNHQAANFENLGKFFKRKLNKTACWLDELELCDVDSGIPSLYDHREHSFGSEYL